jgi:enoyl-CoA hydratase/carnithine racemase
MTKPVLLVEKKNCVGILTLNRPEKANALNTELKRQLLGALDRLSGDDEVGCVLLKGAGRHFCSGQDFNDIAIGTRPEDVLEVRNIFNRLVSPLFERIASMGTPVVAAVRGMVTGEGLPLAITCDLVLASETTVFQFPGTNLAGISIGPGVVAARYMGIRRALQYLLTGEALLARDAERFDMVNRVLADSQLEAEATALAEKVARKVLTNPAFIKDLGKTVFYQALDMERSKAYRYSHEALAAGFCTPQAMQGAQKLLEGRYTKADLQLEGLV